MRTLVGTIITAAVLAAGGAFGFTVDDKLPAGNVIVEGIDGDLVRLKKDLRAVSP